MQLRPALALPEHASCLLPVAVVALQVRVTPMRTEVIIRATRTQSVLGELAADNGRDLGAGSSAGQRQPWQQRA